MGERERDSRWRRVARDVIYQASLEYEAGYLAREGKFERSEYLRFLRGRYPFVERKYFPYKVWLEEVRKAVVFMETGESVRYFHCFHERTWRKRVVDSNPDQMSLF